MFFLCSYRAYWLINIYYVPKYAQISSVNIKGKAVALQALTGTEGG
jgi:hypothetical protein